VSDIADVRFTRTGPVAVAHVVGEIDLSNARLIHRAIELGSDNQELGLIVDLSEVRFLDSSGIHMLFDLARRCGERQQSFALVVPPDSPVHRALDLGGVLGTLHVLSSVSSLEEGSPPA
jgi:anti-anti-sigma factor